MSLAHAKADPRDHRAPDPNQIIWLDMADYIAFIHKDPAQGHLASFPDLPGLAIAAGTLDGVWREAEAALAIHIREMVEHGEAVPAPSTLDMLAREHGYKDALAVVAIHVPDIAAPTVRVNVVLTEDLLRRIDERAAAHGFTRSGFLVQAARKALDAA
ncbi:MAG: type II toxin-antitoxin system HicB family antitoxin [Methyloceanibacter sp.]